MSNVAPSDQNVVPNSEREWLRPLCSETTAAPLNERHALQVDARPYQAQQYQDMGPPGINGRWY
jgi:hypothetical protein